MSDHHYFASCALGWATAPTRKEAIEKMCNHFTQDLKRATLNAQKRGEIGCYMWSVKVLVPETTNYEINFYAPRGVEKEYPRDHWVTYITQKTVAYHTPQTVENCA